MSKQNKKKKIKIKINGRFYSGEQGQTILEIAQAHNIYIPALCHHPDLKLKANCRVCLVEIKGKSQLATSCSVLAEDGMEVLTDSKRVKVARNTNLKLIFSQHLEKCFDCTFRFNCDLLNLAQRYKLKITDFMDRKNSRPTYKFAQAVEIDGSQCIDCRNCLEACNQIQKINFLELKGKGIEQEIVPTKDKKIDCIYCGQCTLYCPVASAQEQMSFPEIEKILEDKKGKILIALVAPAVRFSIGEEFSLPVGQDNSGRLVGALKKLGFDQVFDVNFGADITTLVEALELLERLDDKKAKLPMITSCCPAWVKYLEFHRPDLIPNLTSSRSPHIHLAGILKTYWAYKKKVKPEDIYIVSIMPCTAKKFEIDRPELKIKNLAPVDKVLTIRELAFMIKKKGFNFKKIKAGKFSPLLDEGSGAGQIYASSGGVLESALRTATSLVCEHSQTKVCRPRLDFKELRGSAGFKETIVDLGFKKLRVAVVNGIGQIDYLLNNLNSYDYVEVMACPGGCIAGGGQPLPSSQNIISQRRLGIYRADKNKAIRRANDNKKALGLISWLKKEGLESEVLHTKYSKKIKK